MEIYKITNKINKKIYIGATISDAGTRFKQHINACGNGVKIPLYEAMRKYGWINFEAESLDSTPTTIDELNKLETHYINKLNAKDPKIGYNIVDNNYSVGFIAKSSLNEADITEIRNMYSKCEHGPRYW